MGTRGLPTTRVSGTSLTEARGTASGLPGAPVQPSMHHSQLTSQVFSLSGTDTTRTETGFLKIRSRFCLLAVHFMTVGFSAHLSESDLSDFSRPYKLPIRTLRKRQFLHSLESSEESGTICPSAERGQSPRKRGSRWDPPCPLRRCKDGSEQSPQTSLSSLQHEPRRPSAGCPRQAIWAMLEFPTRNADGDRSAPFMWNARNEAFPD